MDLTDAQGSRRYYFVGLTATGNRTAGNAVAALKLEGKVIASKLGLPLDRREWTGDQKEWYASRCFQEGADWLVNAALGNSDYPGANGEASAYWADVEKMRPYVEFCSRLIDGCAVLDQRSLGQYCDPRLLVEWARERETRNITLTVRDRNLIDGDRLIPAYAYILGSVPLHDSGSPMFSDRGVWEALAEAERAKRARYGYPAPSTDWTGRNEVGGSSWNDACVLSPEEVIDTVLNV